MMAPTQTSTDTIPTGDTPSLPLGVKPISATRRYVLLGLGHLCVGLGIIGAFLPLMPTTVFLIIAAWAYGHASPALRAKLLSHKRFGPMLLAWHREGAMSRKSKIIAVSMMAASVPVTWVATGSLPAVIVQGSILSVVAAYLLTLPRPAMDRAADAPIDHTDEHAHIQTV